MPELEKSPVQSQSLNSAVAFMLSGGECNSSASMGVDERPTAVQHSSAETDDDGQLVCNR